MNNYFDYAASTPVSQGVLAAMAPWEANNFANASSAHQAGRASFQAIQEARELIADKIGALPSEIIFTSGASEANNLALKGIAFKYLNTKGHIITSAIEHKCILNTCAFLESI
ncbi:MAG: aminotransferase class V-fold PLP-dependent enzyme, partial [Enterovibrio sp.]